MQSQIYQMIQVLAMCAKRSAMYDHMARTSKRNQEESRNSGRHLVERLHVLGLRRPIFTNIRWQVVITKMSSILCFYSVQRHHLAGYHTLTKPIQSDPKLLCYAQRLAFHPEPRTYATGAAIGASSTVASCGHTSCLSSLGVIAL